MKKRILSLLPVPIAGCAGGLLCSLLAALTVRGLPRILSFVGGILAPGEEIVTTLVRVFSPMKTAPLRIRPLLPVLVCLLAAGILFAAFRPREKAVGGRRGLSILFRALSVLFAVFLLLFGFLAALWLTEVNGIRFGDVVRSLYAALHSGALDSLSASAVPIIPEVL